MSGPAQCTCSHWTYKRESTPARTQVHTSTHTDQALSELTQTQVIQHTVDVGYYAPAARTTSKPTVFIVFFMFWSEIELVLANPRVLTLWA